MSKQQDKAATEVLKAAALHDGLEPQQRSCEIHSQGQAEGEEEALSGTSPCRYGCGSGRAVSKVDREVVLLRALKFGLRIKGPKGHTFGMQDDGHFYVVGERLDGTEKLLGVDMTMQWFFQIARNLSEEEVIELGLNLALNEVNRKDRANVAQLAGGT